MATQAARIAALEAHVEQLTEALRASHAAADAAVTALAVQVTHAHTRIDAAGAAFKGLHFALKAEPFSSPPPAVTDRIDVAEFNAARNSLRREAAEVGRDERFFPRDMILRRAATLRQAQTAA